jgi:protein-S-isoprenylcysteine O-methyltransferase Ste14
MAENRTSLLRPVLRGEIMKLYKDWAKREFTLGQRLVAFIPEGLFFLILLPVVLILLANSIDRWLSIPLFMAGWWNLAAALPFFIGGFLLAFWSIQAQVTAGRGTPVPMMPTQKLVTQGPFAYCRNPMTLGTLIAYLGFGILIGSYSGLALVLILVGALLVYIKLVEEKELAARFGADYFEYMRRTPFIIPRLRRRN